MSSDYLEAERQIFALACDCAHGDGNGRDTGKIHGNGENILKIHRKRVGFLAELECRRWARGKNNRINGFSSEGGSASCRKRTRKVRPNDFPYRASFPVVRIRIP